MPVRLGFVIGLLGTVVAVIFALVLFDPGGYDYADFSERPGRYPVTRVHLTTGLGGVREASLQLASDVPLGTVLNLEAFKDLQPGTTPPEAAILLGLKPAASGGSQDVIFDTPDGRVHVWLSLGSAGSQGQWSLSVEPSRSSLSDVVLDSTVRAQLLHLLPSGRSVSVGFGSGEDAASLVCSASKVYSIHLWRRKGAAA